jgi:hypothetical protein
MKNKIEKFRAQITSDHKILADEACRFGMILTIRLKV